jgi:hypothetical protein
VSLIIIATLFLLAQLVLLFAWVLLWQRRAHHRSQSQKHLLHSDTRSVCSSSNGSALPAYVAPFSQILYGNNTMNTSAPHHSNHFTISTNKKAPKCASPCSTLSSNLSASRRTLDPRYPGINQSAANASTHYSHDLSIYGNVPRN